MGNTARERRRLFGGGGELHLVLCLAPFVQKELVCELGDALAHALVSLQAGCPRVSHCLIDRLCDRCELLLHRHSIACPPPRAERRGEADCGVPTHRNQQLGPRREAIAIVELALLRPEHLLQRDGLGLRDHPSAGLAVHCLVPCAHQESLELGDA